MFCLGSGSVSPLSLHHTPSADRQGTASPWWVFPDIIHGVFTFLSSEKVYHQDPSPTVHLHSHPHFHLYVPMPTSRKVLTLTMCPLSPLVVHSEKLCVNPLSSAFPRKLMSNSHKLPNYFLWKHIEQYYFFISVYFITQCHLSK